MRSRAISDPIIWTHALFLANSYLYFHNGYRILAVSLFINCILSLMHHLYHEESDFWQFADEVSCRISLGLISVFIIKYCSLVQIFYCVFWLFLSLILLELGTMYDYRKFHSLWHVAVFIGNLIVWNYLP